MNNHQNIIPDLVEYMKANRVKTISIEMFEENPLRGPNPTEPVKAEKPTEPVKEKATRGRKSKDTTEKPAEAAPEPANEPEKPTPHEEKPTATPSPKSAYDIFNELIECDSANSEKAKDILILANHLTREQFASVGSVSDARKVAIELMNQDEILRIINEFDLAIETDVGVEKMREEAKNWF